MENDGSFACMLLSPDFRVHGDADRLLDAIQAIGANIVSALHVPVSPFDLTSLYEGRITHAERRRNSDSVWLSRNLHSLGSSVLLFMHAPGTRNLQEELSRLKGSSVRGETPDDTIRGHSKMVDRCFSLVHTPDDACGFELDCQILLGQAPRFNHDVLQSGAPRILVNELFIENLHRAPATALVESLLLLTYVVLVSDADGVKKRFWRTVRALGDARDAIANEGCRTPNGWSWFRNITKTALDDYLSLEEGEHRHTERRYFLTATARQTLGRSALRAVETEEPQVRHFADLIDALAFNGCLLDAVAKHRIFCCTGIR